MFKMKKTILVLIIAFSLIGIAFAGTLLSGTSTIDISREDKTTLASVGVLNPTISQLVCDGTTCRACSSDKGYGMGCIDIPQKYCSSYSKCDEGNTTCKVECLIYTDFTDAELKQNRDEAFKLRWEGIADAIRQRQAKQETAKVDAGQVIINEK